MTTLHPLMRAALQSALLAVPGIPTVGPVKQIAFDNVRYVPVVGQAYVSTTCKWLREVPLEVGHDDAVPSVRHYGIFGVGVFQPTGSNPIAGETLADQIRLAFKPASYINYAPAGDLVIVTTELKGVVTDPDWANWPIVINFRTDQPRTV